MNNVWKLSKDINNVNNYPYAYMIIRAATWFRDSHGLFDFDAKRYMESEIYFKNSGFIGRTSDDMIKFMYSKQDEILENDSEDGLHIQKYETKALISVIRYKDQYYAFTK